MTFSNRDLVWRGNALATRSSKKVVVSIAPDPVWPGMLRVRRGDQLSDMVNATRARDAARAGARAVLNKAPSNALGAPLVRQKRRAA